MSGGSLHELTEAELLFAIPLKPRSRSDDWQVAEANLRRTIRSVQNAARNHVVQICVACHDVPDLREVDDGRISVLRVDFPEPSGISEGNRDKVRKRRAIGAWARAKGGGDLRVAFLDADDLVHRRFVDAVVESNAPSRLVTDGYLVDAGSGIMACRRGTFYTSCGSGFVCRFRRDELPISWEDLDAPFSQFGGAPDSRGHAFYGEVAAELGRPAEPLGFAGIAYLVNHPESMWQGKGRGTRPFQYPSELVWPTAARRILTEDFAAPELAVVVAGRARTASVFGRAVLGRTRSRGGAKLARIRLLSGRGSRSSATKE